MALGYVTSSAEATVEATVCTGHAGLEQGRSNPIPVCEISEI